MKSSWTTVSAGLDQLFFSPLIKDESVEDRSEAIDNLLKSNGWSWDDVIEEMVKDTSDGRPMRA